MPATDDKAQPMGSRQRVVAPGELSPPSRSRTWWTKVGLLLLKLCFSAAVLWWVVARTLARDGAEGIRSRLDTMSWSWWGLAVVMQLVAVGFAVARWDLLLRGQGIVAAHGFLIRSFLIGRFFGAFTPGGLGLDGWRLYDLSARTRRYAKVFAVAGVEKVLGQLAFGAVVLLGSFWGYRIIGAAGVVLVNGMFAALVVVGLTLLSRPGIFAQLARLIPSFLRPRFLGLVEAVSAYQGRTGLLVRASLAGVAVHVFNNLIYVCAARSLGIELSPFVVFFASSLQIMATLLPISLNGFGLREMTAAALYTSAAVGLSHTDALLIPLAGIAAEYAVSLTGLVPFILRQPSAPVLTVDGVSPGKLASTARSTAAVGGDAVVAGTVEGSNTTEGDLSTGDGKMFSLVHREGALGAES